MPPTKQSTTPQKTDETSVSKEPCGDDEDCMHGSGDSGSVTESFTSTTARGTGSYHYYFLSTSYLLKMIPPCTEITDRTSLTAFETTKAFDETSTTNRQTTLGTTSGSQATSLGTSTAIQITRNQATSAVTRPETTWPSSTSIQHMTTVPIQDTTHYHISSTPDMNNNIIDHTKDDFQ